jgi:hypothetical protein
LGGAGVDNAGPVPELVGLPSAEASISAAPLIQTSGNRPLLVITCGCLVLCNLAYKPATDKFSEVKKINLQKISKMRSYTWLSATPQLKKTFSFRYVRTAKFNLIIRRLIHKHPFIIARKFKHTQQK